MLSSRIFAFVAFFSVVNSLPIPTGNPENPTPAVSAVVSIFSPELAPLFATPTSDGAAAASSVAPLPTEMPSIPISFELPPQVPQLTDSAQPVPTAAPSLTPMYTAIPTPPPACLAKAAALSASASAPNAAPTDGSQLSTNPDLQGRQVLRKRVAQTDLHDVAQSWQDLCFASGGDTIINDPCVQLAGIKGINALLADADTCDQQDNADAMVDFAKSAGITNADALIANAVAYLQHPRNAVNLLGVIPSTPYCQRPPRNPELQGVVPTQLAEVNPYVFGGPTVGMVPFGDATSCPYGQIPDVNSCSCVPAAGSSTSPAVESATLV